MIELLLWPLVAGFVLAGIHAYFGMHVLARGVVFVDLSLAQVAALGLTIAILAGHSVQSEAGYWYAFAFAIGGAALFALARPYEKLLQQEAVIGIVYAVSASIGVLALDRAPQGAEHIKQLLIGSILIVTPQEVAHIALLYAAIGAVHLIFRQPLLEISFHPLLAAALRRNVPFLGRSILRIFRSGGDVVGAHGRGPARVQLSHHPRGIGRSVCGGPAMAAPPRMGVVIATGG